MKFVREIESSVVHETLVQKVFYLTSRIDPEVIERISDWLIDDSMMNMSEASSSPSILMVKPVLLSRNRAKKEVPD